jgi:hypothetical protein
MNQLLHLNIGQTLKLSGRHGTIKFVDNDHILVGYADKTSTVFKSYELIQAINEHIITIIDKPMEIRCVGVISDEDQAECDRRSAYCEAFFDFKKANPTKGLNQDLIDEVYEEISETHAIKSSISRLYAWYKLWLADGKDMALQVVKDEGAIQDMRLSDDVLEFMDNMISRHYMTDSQPTMRTAYKKFTAAFSRKKRDFNGIDVPCRSSFERRIKRWPKYEKDLARYGKKHADRENSEASQTYNVTNVLDLVECDGVEINMGLLNEDGSYAGKVGIIAAVDVKTRACIGYSVVIGQKPKESAAAVIHCLSHSMRLKPDPKASPMSGIGLNYVFDNGPGFRALMTKKYMNAIGSDVTYCRSGAPKEKPHVERMFGSWRTLFFKGKLGYLGKRKQEVIPEKTIKQAARLTVTQFMVMFEDYIQRVYHHTPNRLMNNFSPFQMWEKHARMDEVITLSDLDDRTKIRGNAKTLHCAINSGISHRGERFSSHELLVAVKSMMNGSDAKSHPVDVLIDDFDASGITAVIGQKMIDVPNVKDVPRNTSFGYLKSLKNKVDESKLPESLTPRQATNIIKKKRANGTLVEQDTLIMGDEIKKDITKNMEKDFAENTSTITEKERQSTNGFGIKRTNKKGN